MNLIAVKHFRALTWDIKHTYAHGPSATFIFSHATADLLACPGGDLDEGQR